MSEKNKSFYTTQEDIDNMLEELEHAYDVDLSKQKTFTREKVFKYISSVVFLLILCVLGKISFDVNNANAKGEVPTVFGYQIYEVQTGSMDPTLPVNSLILSKVVKPSTILEEGDIITFVQNNQTITHRIIEVVKDGDIVQYRTKGDYAENSIDPYLLAQDDIKAKYIMKLPFYLSSSDDASGGENDG